MPLWIIPLIAVGVGILKKSIPDKYKKWLPWVSAVTGAVVGAGQAADAPHVLQGLSVGLAAVGLWETAGKSGRAIFAKKVESDSKPEETKPTS